MNSNTLWVFIDDSKSNNKKYFLTMFIITEYSNFDNELKILRNILKNFKKDKTILTFLNKPKYHNYLKLNNKHKHLVNNFITEVNAKIIEHGYLIKKIDKLINIDFYYKDHIKQISNLVLEKYKHKYKTIIFDHSSNPKVNNLILYENNNIKILQGDDEKDTGLIVVDLLRTKINF